ncbi:MAG TPA: DUF3613 domain-containing protein [Paraburkholderia sp.]|nr:DUF3613 domain-containing protein [Paraburkholderia sp.]
MNDFRITEQLAQRVGARIALGVGRITASAFPKQTAKPVCASLLASLLAALLAALLFGSGIARAQAPDNPVNPRIGESTAAWVQLQASNTEAAAPQPMLGEEATAAYRRYLDSFNNKIPLFFQSSLQSQQGGGGQGGGTN